MAPSYRFVGGVTEQKALSHGASFPPQDDEPGSRFFRKPPDLHTRKPRTDCTAISRALRDLPRPESNTVGIGSLT